MSDKVRILRIVTRLNVGGVSFLVNFLHDSFSANEKFEELVLFGNCGRGEPEYTQNFKNGSWEKISSLQRKPSIFRDLKTLFKIVRKIQEYRPAIVDLHMFKAGLLGRLAVILCINLKCKVIYHVHGHLLDGYLSKMEKRLYLWIEKILASKTSVFVFDGLRVKSDFYSVGILRDRKSYVFMPGVLPSSTPGTRASRTGNLRVGWVGRLTEIKRPEIFLRLASDVNAMLPDVKFLMFGEGELKDQTIKRIHSEGNLVELRNFSQNVYRDVLSKFDLLVVTSANEGTPLIIMEAAMVGIPTVALNVGSVGEVISHNKTGILCENYEHLFNSIIELQASNPLFEKMSRSALEKAHMEFMVLRYVKQHNSLYSELSTS
jgi:glycosyltransferase involved in cell wall biosynthesis